MAFSVVPVMNNKRTCIWKRDKVDKEMEETTSSREVTRMRGEHRIFT